MGGGWAARRFGVLRKNLEETRFKRARRGARFFCDRPSSRAQVAKFRYYLKKSREIDTMFEQFDTNQSGKLEREQLKRVSRTGPRRNPDPLSSRPARTAVIVTRGDQCRRPRLIRAPRHLSVPAQAIQNIETRLKTKDQHEVWGMIVQLQASEQARCERASAPRASERAASERARCEQ